MAMMTGTNAKAAGGTIATTSAVCAKKNARRQSRQRLAPS